MLTLDDVRNDMLDFGRRLVNGNSADCEKAWAAVAKVGRLMATRVISGDLYVPDRCTACPICHEEPEALQHAGSGNPSAYAVLVGQGAGEHEGRYGLPFVGIAGCLLTMALEDAGMPRESVWITNTVRCRPKDNRAPAPHETRVCMEKYLYREIDVIKPRVIIALGMSALQSLVPDLPSTRMGDLRGRVFRTEIKGREYPVIATYHPAFVVRKHGAEFEKAYSAMVADLTSALEVEVVA